jgi:hypothetical protein
MPCEAPTFFHAELCSVAALIVCLVIIREKHIARIEVLSNRLSLESFCKLRTKGVMKTACMTCFNRKKIETIRF